MFGKKYTVIVSTSARKSIVSKNWFVVEKEEKYVYWYIIGNSLKFISVFLVKY